jgi:hypothetical protein
MQWLPCALVVSFACHKQDPPPAASGASAQELATKAALVAFQLAPGQEDRVDLELVGDETAGIAREKLVGICSVLYVAGDGSWKEHTKFRGVATQQQLAAPLKTAGTLQEGSTRNDLGILASRMCK